MYYTDDSEISEMCDSDGEVASNSLGHSQSRLTPEMRMLKTTARSATSESESEASSATTTPRPTMSPSPSGLPTLSPSPRGFAIKLQESPRPLTGFVPAFAVSPRRPRQSPRTTGSLDNVDLWEESDNESSDADYKNPMIDPLKTFDFSDLRRSKSPVECKRNKLSNDHEKQQVRTREKPRDKISQNTKQFSAARARAARRLKQIFPNPAVSKPAPKLRIAKPTNNIAGNKETNNTISSRKQKLLPQRESRLAAKFPASSSIKETDKVECMSSKKLFTPDIEDKLQSKNVFQRQNQQKEHFSTKTIANCDKHLPKAAPQCSDKEDKMNSKSLTSTKTDSNMGEFSLANANDEPNFARKVKFNSFVTVRDNEISTLDLLKNSNNSAQMFKNKYLKPQDKEQQSSTYSSGDVSLMLQTIS